MKLLRLKITAPAGFRSLQPGFEHHFRTQWELQEELQDKQAFAPFVCAGPNGSGKSNLLEVLAAIFYHLECIYLENLPDSFRYDEEANPGGFRSEKGIPDGFEIEYITQRPKDLEVQNGRVQIKITKHPEDSPEWQLWKVEQNEWGPLPPGRELRRSLLPDFVLGYSSGVNEILSLPFFKMRFVQFDEYWHALKQQLPYFGRPESRLTYLDSGFSQAILLCNLLFQDNENLKPFREDVGIEELKEFRIIIRKHISVNAAVANEFSTDNDALMTDVETGSNTVNLVKLLEVNEKVLEEAEHDERPGLVDLDKITPIIIRLKRCSTCSFLDETTDTLYLDYYVNDTTKKAFRENFRDLDASGNPALALFHALQVLLTLNLYSVSESLKADLYQSNSLYVSETIPTLASDERIMRIKNFWVTKTDVAEPVLLKSFSDGEHQLLHTLGLCLLFKNTQSLFLLDEPETHFNPDWRANFVTRLDQSFNGSDDHEMLVTTHAPFLISDSKPEKVLVFNKADGVVSVTHPDYNTLGASINKITLATFDKRETIGLRAQTILDVFRSRSQDDNENKNQLIAEINRQLGDSVEKVLLIKTILDSMEGEG